MHEKLTAFNKIFGIKQILERSFEKIIKQVEKMSFTIEIS